MGAMVEAYQAHQAAQGAQPNPRPPATGEPKGQMGTVPPGGPTAQGKPAFPPGAAALPKRS